MKITILGSGTSQGVPVISCDCPVCKSLDYRDNRLRSAVRIQTGDVSLVIDTGPDFRQQMLRHRVDHLDAVLLTHSHKDHIAGLDDVRAFNFKQGTDIPLYGTSSTLNRIKEEFYYSFSSIKYPGVPNLELCYIDEAPFEIKGVSIIPISVLHHKMPVTGFRIGDFTYITDANFIPDESKAKIVGSQVLVVNALQQSVHISHFTLNEAVSLAQELSIPQTYFTHISHKMGLHAEVARMIPEGCELAYDGLAFELD